MPQPGRQNLPAPLQQAQQAGGRQLSHIPHRKLPGIEQLPRLTAQPAHGQILQPRERCSAHCWQHAELSQVCWHWHSEELWVGWAESGWSIKGYKFLHKLQEMSCHQAGQHAHATPH